MPLTINIESKRLWDDKNNEFINIPSMSVTMEHSLISVSKWESKWKKKFLDKDEQKTTEEFLDYFSQMCIKPNNVDWKVFLALNDKQVKEIVDYISDEKTATKIYSFKNKGGSREKISSELIYYWMVAANIPFDPCEKWHLSRLLKLIEIYGVKNDTSSKKMSPGEISKQNYALNRARRAKLGTKG